MPTISDGLEKHNENGQTLRQHFPQPTERERETENEVERGKGGKWGGGGVGVEGGVPSMIKR